MPAPKTKQRYKAIVFDLDGTLADSLEVGLEAMNRLRFLFGYKKLDRDNPDLRLLSGADFIKKILQLNVIQMIAWLKLLKLLVNRQAHRIQVHDGWDSVLKTLKTNHRIGLITSAPKKYAHTILKSAGLHDLFDFEITNVKYHRKDKSLKRMLNEQNLAPTDALYIGDELRDLAACQKQGVAFVAVSWGKDHEDVFKIKSEDLAGLIDKPSDLLTGKIL